MNRSEWSTFIGPGRHPISSAYFWYVNSPLGGAFEYYTNDDYLTEEWQPRVEEHRQSFSPSGRLKVVLMTKPAVR